MDFPIHYSVKFEKGRKKYGIDFYGKSVASLCRRNVLNSLAGGYRYYINKFVPKKSGALRKSARAKFKLNGEADAGGNGTGSATIYWGDSKKTAKYVHYQFVGDVYGPNKAVFNKAGKHVGWRSPKGKDEKYNTGRKMGEGTPFTYELSDGRVVTVKGYTTKGTGYDWIQKFKDDNGDYGEKAINIRAARYLYEASCIISHKKPVGGSHIYRSWNQIKHRFG